jgi:hypothetical protein
MLAADAHLATLDPREELFRVDSGQACLGCQFPIMAGSFSRHLASRPMQQYPTTGHRQAAGAAAKPH